jgi:pimeloyl-ACP methyl ester carboxylesterase
MGNRIRERSDVAGLGHRVVVAVFVGLGLIGCNADSPPTAAPATSSPAEPTSSQPPDAIHPTCVRPDEQANVIRFRNAEGVRLVGVLLGDGRTGILLGPELRGSLCGWMPVARQLAERGYRVLAFDFGGFGESESAAGRRTLVEDVVAAADQLDRAGAKRVVLIGASMGGTAVVSAATEVTAPVAAVVSLSGPAVFGALDAETAAADLTMPAYFAAGERDGSFPDSARRMYAAAGSEIKELKIYDTSRHGIQLVNELPESMADLLVFLDDVAAAG